MNMNMKGMFGKIANGLCRVSVDGGIAIKTSQGYKTYNVETGALVNCDNFAFDIGSDFFFVVPTNKVRRGDIILAGGKPRCVVDVQPNSIQTFNYENSTLETLVPERHLFFGRNYMYGRIMSPFGNMFGSEKGAANAMKFMMMSQMFGGGKMPNGTDINPMMFMMMGGGSSLFDGMFDGMFDVEEAEEEKK